MNHSVSTLYAARTIHSVTPSQAPALEAMDFARPAVPAGFDVPQLPRGHEPLAQPASAIPAVKPPTAEPSQVTVHESKRGPVASSSGATLGSGPGPGASALSDLDLILMHPAAHHDASTPSSSSTGWDSCFGCMDTSLTLVLRGADALLRECGALYRAAGAQCSDLIGRAEQCERPALSSRCEQLSQAGHELWAGFGQCCDGGLQLCESILKCRVTTCSSICDGMGQLSCPSCSCDCDCNCSGCGCDCGGCTW